MRDKVTQLRARQLRNQSTDAERLLWRHLRRQQLGGFRFRRQFPVGRYIADFMCVEAALVIELDGGQHNDQSMRDRYRDAVIEGKGCRVLRFWNNQVFEETEAVLEVILKELETRCPHPVLLPRFKCSLAPQAGEGTKGMVSRGKRSSGAADTDEGGC